MHALAAALVLWLASCGIKGPPKPRAARAESAQALYRATGALREEGRIVLSWVMPPAAWADGPKKVLVERHEPHDGSEGPSCGKRAIVGRVAATQRVEWSVAQGARTDGGVTPDVTYRLVAGDGTPLSDSVLVSDAR